MPGAPRDPEGPSRPQNRADSVLLATTFHQGLLVKGQAEPCVFGQGQGRRLPDGPRPGQAVPGHRVAAAGRGRGYGCASIAAPAARSVRKPLLRHPAPGCVVCSDPRLEIDSRNRLGCRHQPEAELTRFVSIGRAPVCTTAAGFGPHREARSQDLSGPTVGYRGLAVHCRQPATGAGGALRRSTDRKSTRLNSSHLVISYAVFCLSKKNTNKQHKMTTTSPVERSKLT